MVPLAEPPTVSELFRKCAQKDAAAWEEFLRRHGPTIHGMARSTLRRVLGAASEADVENVFQGVVISLLERGGRKLLSFEGRSDPDAWLRTVTARFALNYLRSEKVRGTLRFRPLQNAPEPAAPASESPLDPAEVEPLLALLKPVERAALAMHVFDGLAYDEIARALRVPVNTVASHIHRARQKLKES